MPTAAAQGDIVLRVTDVDKRFHRGIWPRRRAIDVLRGASLEVRAGELVGLVGENGSGKSTLMQIIVGLLRRDAGKPERPARLGYCPQVPMLWDKLTVDEHFALFARAYGLGKAARDRAFAGLHEELSLPARLGDVGAPARRGHGHLIVSHLLAERERLDRMYELCDGRICNC